MSLERAAKRLMRMSPAEAASRGTRLARIVAERVGPAGRRRECTAAHLARAMRSGGDPHRWLTEFRTAPRTTFFAGLADRDATRAALDELSPGAVERLTARADRLMLGRFDLLGHRDLCFGDPVDWHLDPLLGLRSPAVHWSRIRYLEAGVAGDHKLVWELNRHHHLVVLGAASWLVGDPRYAAAALRQLEGWLDANPPKVGINWASSLELAFRVVSWCWFLHLVRDQLRPELFARVLGSLEAHGRHIERFLSTYFSPNTHLTGEALGLIYLGSCFPMFRRAAHWRRLGWRVFEREVERQVLPDGVYFEQATWYHRYTADFLVHALLLGMRTGQPSRPRLARTLERMLEYLAAVMRPDGTTPLVGDDDGGRLLPLDGPPSDDFRATLRVGAAVVGREDLARVAAGCEEELVWLAGPASAARVRGEGEPEAGARVFPAGGWVTVRDRWSAASDHLVFDCGAHGALSCGHAHADALGVQLAIDGRTLFVDPGTFTYTAEPAARDLFRGTAAHNTVVVDGAPSWVPGGPFGWNSEGRARLERQAELPSLRYFEGVHDGYARLDDPVVHQRAVIQVVGDYWVLLDRLLARGSHRVAVCFQLAAGLRATHGAGGVVLVEDKTSSVTALARLQTVGAQETWVGEGAVSRCYGRREPAPRLELRRAGTGTQQLISLVMPARLGACEAIECVPNARAVRVATERWTDLLLFPAAGESVEAEGVRGRARAAWLRRHRDGGIDFAAIDVEELVVDGRSLVLEPAPSVSGRLGRTAAGDVPSYPAGPLRRSEPATSGIQRR